MCRVNESVDLITPIRIGNSAKPTVIYTWEQLICIRAIRDFRQEVSLDITRKIVIFLLEKRFDEALYRKRLVAINDQVFWVEEDWSDLPKIMASLCKKGKLHSYVISVIATLPEIIEQIYQVAKVEYTTNISSFLDRAKSLKKVQMKGE